MQCKCNGKNPYVAVCFLIIAKPQAQESILLLWNPMLFQLHLLVMVLLLGTTLDEPTFIGYRFRFSECLFRNRIYIRSLIQF